MRRCTPFVGFALLLTAGWLTAGGAAKYTVKVAEAAPPAELADSIKQVLGGQAVQFHAQGDLIAELWLRTEVPADATPEQLKNGVTYREVPQSTVLGAVRFVKPWTDYRKQVVKAGVYTLRLGYQPQDGDHMGTAPHSEFCVLVAAAKDKKIDPLEPKMMIELSAASLGTTHPGVLLLFPNSKPGKEPAMTPRPNNHFSLNTGSGIAVKGQKTTAVLGIGLTLVGHAE